MVKYASTYKGYTIKRSEKDLFDYDYTIFSDFLYKGICCGHMLSMQFK